MREPDEQLRRYAEAAARTVPPTDLARVQFGPSRRPRRTFLAAAVLVLVAGLGTAFFSFDRADPGARVSTDPAGPSSGSSELPFGLVRCESDNVGVTAAPELYRDEPVYVGNEMPTAEVQTWAQNKPGFEGIWIDRSHNGWITVAFSQDADQRQTELEETFPGVGVVAVAVDWTKAELEQLREDAFAAMSDAGFDAGGGVHISSGVVYVMVGELSEERLAPLAPFAGPRLCVEGLESEDVVPEGPQPTEGDGWRLLGTGRTGASYRTGIATTPDQYEALWDASGLSGGPAGVDFEHEVVIWFGAVYGSGCDIRMDDVVSDVEQHLVHAAFVVPGSPQACNADANPKAYVVAVERGRLPEGRFAIQLNATDPPQGVPEERTVVDADLRSPGSVASDEQIGADPELTGAAERGYVVTAGGVMETGYPALYDLDLSCPFDLLGPFNGVTWQANTQDLAAHPPEAWTAGADNRGIVEVELLLEEAPARLTVTANGHTESYEPSPTASSTCP